MKQQQEQTVLELSLDSDAEQTPIPFHSSVRVPRNVTKTRYCGVGYLRFMHRYQRPITHTPWAQAPLSGLPLAQLLIYGPIRCVPMQQQIGITVELPLSRRLVPAHRVACRVLLAIPSALVTTSLKVGSPQRVAPTESPESTAPRKEAGLPQLVY